METPVELKPVAYFYCDKLHPQDAAKQGSLDSKTSSTENLGEVRIQNENNFQQALEDLEGFSHLWIIYQFHLNTEWKPKVLPPRGSDQKRGVFATRSPYRPNPVGLSCVEIVRIAGLSIWVRNFDLLNETPIFDIKPYLPYADSFPEAKIGWLEGCEEEIYRLTFSNSIEAQLSFLKTHSVSEIRSFITNQLSFEPLNKKKKRLLQITQNSAVLCYRTWRISFKVTAEDKTVIVENIFSGYCKADLENHEDIYQDKEIHRLFRRQFPL